MRRSNRAAWGFYAQDRSEIDDWTVTLNARCDRVRTDRDDRATVDNDHETDDAAFSDRVELACRFENGLVSSASASRFFEPQIGTDSDRKPVGPQDGQAYEVGVKYAPLALDALIGNRPFILPKIWPRLT